MASECRSVTRRVAVHRAIQRHPTASPVASNPTMEATVTKTREGLPMDSLKRTTRANKMQNLKSASLIFLIAFLFPFLVSAEGVGNITHLGGVLRATRADGTSRI